MLYDELSWQPRDIDGIQSIINNCHDTKGVEILQMLAEGEDLPKYIYSIRNSIVHETKDARIPLTDDAKWENIIEGMLYLLLEI